MVTPAPTLQLFCTTCTKPFIRCNQALFSQSSCCQQGWSIPSETTCLHLSSLKPNTLLSPQTRHSHVCVTSIAVIVTLSVPSNDCRGYWLKVNPLSLYLNKDSLFNYLLLQSDIMKFYFPWSSCRLRGLRTLLPTSRVAETQHTPLAAMQQSHSQRGLFRIKYFLDSKLSIFAHINDLSINSLSRGSERITMITSG